MISVKTIVDLSHDLSHATTVYPGDPVPNITIATTIAKHGYNLFNVSLGSQSGSHVDAPYHFSDTGRTVDKIGLELCMGRACIVDASLKKANESINIKDIKPYTAQIKTADVVLFRTDWYKKAGQPDFLNHPYLSEDGGHFLQANGIQTIGIDAINIDATGKDRFPIHDMYAASGGLIAENLAHFDKIEFDNPFFIALPLKLTGCDGSPVRAVAVQFHDE